MATGGARFRLDVVGGARAGSVCGFAALSALPPLRVVACFSLGLLVFRFVWFWRDCRLDGLPFGLLRRGQPVPISAPLGKQICARMHVVLVYALLLGGRPAHGGVTPCKRRFCTSLPAGSPNARAKGAFVSRSRSLRGQPGSLARACLDGAFEGLRGARACPLVCVRS